MARDIDYSDRFELITLPGSDSIRLAAAPPPAMPGPRPATGTAAGKTSGGAAPGGGLNYPPYQTPRAPFAGAGTPPGGGSAGGTPPAPARGAVRRGGRPPPPPPPPP